MFESAIALRGAAIDLEVGRESGRIHKMAAVRGDKADSPFLYSRGNLHAALRKLDAFVEGSEFLLGHNLISFDLPRLRAVAPDLRLLVIPAIDTLRLSPLAFPRNPYHRLVKHYKDGSLLRSNQNDPELDARICLQLLAEEEDAFRQLIATNPDLLAAWHWLTLTRREDAGFDRFFAHVRGAPRPADAEGRAAIATCLHGQACVTRSNQMLEAKSVPGWPMAYALAWLSVAGGNSVMPPWVRHEFPEAAHLVRQLRNLRCDDIACSWCQDHHNPKQVLKRWFGFEAFRAEPACEDGRSMQEAIVDVSMRGEHVLGILPTGTGKSVCYQVPALSRYENTGSLTVVISPLVALMADQVHGLRARGISSCAALNGLLSMPERSDVLDRVRLGDIAILLVSPEQLRNSGFRKAVQQRETGGWVLDEAHCLSKWGHDFRTDYRYVGRFIQESTGTGVLPPIVCLTATAKPDVVADIRGYFQSMLNVDLRVLNGGASRENLDFFVTETTPAHKLPDIHSLLQHALPSDQTGGAIVYCATRNQTEEVARFLTSMGWSAAYFHAGLTPELKKETQQRFIAGGIHVIAATNAFGMGIDKPDVRLVIHADIPGSLENYVQEAGRAGRDQRAARCVLLHCKEDVEQQFGLSARSRLPHHEIQAVLRALRRMAGKHRPLDKDVEVVATPGEILAEDHNNDFVRDSATDDTRVRTAVSWLEQAGLVAREENRYHVFPSTLRTANPEEVDARLTRVPMPRRGQLRAIVQLLMHADPAEGVSTDELMGVARLSSSGVSRAMYDLERLGIITNDSIFTALVHAGVEKSSRKRMESASAVELALIDALREEAPDLEKDSSSVLFLRRVSQRLKNDGHAEVLPERIYRLLQSLASDGRSDDQGIGSLRLRRIDADSVCVTLQRDWEPMRKTADIRRAASTLLLEHLLSRIAPGVRGNDLLAETTIGNLHAAVESDLVLKAQIKDVCRLVERALLWLHEQEVLRLGRGLVVFRPAMSIRVAPGNAPFTRSHYAELQDHYNEQVVQIHVMAEYARRGLQSTVEALALVSDYFSLDRLEFIRRWFPQAAKNLSRQTTDETWHEIVETLSRVQRDIVTDERDQTNVLVLAGPGSGKTRVLVNRIAFLVRVRRENPGSILALAYNRHAAVEIRRRLRELIGNDANGVTVLTCHALAMRLTGSSFTERAAQDVDFAKVLSDAVRLLKGDGLMADEADDQRERLLSGFRWILVDEYQDIGPDQYELISALAGRTLNDPDRKLSLFAVGDDDQNVYGFAGASVAYIRRFQEDYRAKPEFLTANYRSTANIIDACNRVISVAGNRMKTNHPIEIDTERRTDPVGGRWESLDPVTKGRVHVLEVAPSSTSQAEQVMREMVRLSECDPEWNWSSAAVVARQWRLLHPVFAFCHANNIPVQRADQDPPQFWRLRETQKLVEWLNQRGVQPIARVDLNAFLAAQPDGPWWDLLVEAIATYGLECGDGPLPAAHLREWLAEWGREVRQQQRGLLLLTAHRVKGLEFDHVAVLDGAWEDRDPGEDPDAACRLFYVAMTRARKTLTLASMNGRNKFQDQLINLVSTFRRDAPVATGLASDLDRRYEMLTPGDVDLGFAGRFVPGAAVHQAVAELRPGDSLELVRKDDRWLLEKGGQPVGRLASSYTPPGGMQCIEARVHAVLVRFRRDGEEAYADSIRSDRWEVILPELIFARQG